MGQSPVEGFISIPKTETYLRWSRQDILLGEAAELAGSDFDLEPVAGFSNFFGGNLHIFSDLKSYRALQSAVNQRGFNLIVKGVSTHSILRSLIQNILALSLIIIDKPAGCTNTVIVLPAHPIKTFDRETTLCYLCKYNAERTFRIICEFTLRQNVN
jgi:hypothetical protein